MCDKNVFGMEFMDDYYVFFVVRFPLKDDAKDQFLRSLAVD